MSKTSKTYIDSVDLHVTKLVDFVVRVPDHLSLHFYDFFVILYAFLNFTAKLRETCTQTLKQKRKITTGSFVGLLHSHTLSVVFCYLPMPVFGSVVAGIEIAGVEGGSGARVAGGVEEEELRVDECQAHEHRECMGKLLG